MELRKFIKTTIREYLNEQQILNENNNNVDQILDKINKDGLQSLTYDERTYLKQYNNKNINYDLEKWLFSDEDETFDSKGNKLLFDEFEDDEDIMYNHNKLKRVISKHLNKKSFTNNADWGGGDVWNIKSNNNLIGIFLYLGDDELVVLKRNLLNDEYNDDVIKNITNSKELYRFFLSLKKQIGNDIYEGRKIQINENYIKSDARGYNIGNYIYHITPQRNISQIKRNGFVPKDGVSINGKPFENRLYFATSLIAAYDLYMNFSSYKEDKEYVIFKLKSNCINDGYEEDDLFKHGIYVDYPISYNCVVDVINAEDLFGKYNADDLDNLY